jgi:hypothetical protein
MTDHRDRVVRNIAVVNIPLARPRRAVGVGKILVEMFDQIAAPDQVAARIAVSEGDDVIRFVGEQRERNDETFVALSAGDGASNQSLSKQLEDSIVRGAHQVHPGINPEKCVCRRMVELFNTQVACLENRGRNR